jgi:hypothetical protein
VQVRREDMCEQLADVVKAAAARHEKLTQAKLLQDYFQVCHIPSIYPLCVRVGLPRPDVVGNNSTQSTVG